jgi:hypothetical protein
LGSKEGSQPGKSQSCLVKKTEGEITIFYQLKVKISVGRIQCGTFMVLFLGTWN